MVTQRPDDERPERNIEPGDEATPGTPGTGEDICRRCEGTGRVGGDDCPECGGSGYVIRGIGGA